MDRPVRIGMLEADEGLDLLFIPKPGVCELSGRIGRLLQPIIVDGFMAQGYNCTLIHKDYMGNLNHTTKMYDGLKGDLQSKKIDMLLVPLLINAPFMDDVTYSLPLYEDFLYWASAYNYTDDEPIKQDIIDLYLAFPKSYYLAVILSLLAFIISWKLCEKVTRRISKKLRNEFDNARLPTSWIMMRAVLDQDQYPNISRVAFSLLSLCISVCFYVTIDCFILNTMSTDLVVYKQPANIRNYEDAIGREGLKIAFGAGMDEARFFDNATRGSPEYEIWQKRYMIKSLETSVITDLAMPIVNQQMVGILRKWVLLTVANYGQRVARETFQIGYGRALMTKDETGKSFTNAIGIQKNAPKVLHDHLHKRTYTVTESGILNWIVQERFPKIFGGSEILTDIAVSANVETPVMPMPHIEMTNFIKIWYIYFSLLILATYVLIFEHLQHSEVAFRK